jgi:hypothetical protein
VSDVEPNRESEPESRGNSELLQVEMDLGLEAMGVWDSVWESGWWAGVVERGEEGEVGAHLRHAFGAGYVYGRKQGPSDPDLGTESGYTIR